MSQKLLFFSLGLLFLTACEVASHSQASRNDTVKNVKEVQPSQNEQGIANPASVYCQEKGFTLVMRTNEQGTYGVCVLPDKTECDEWAFFRGECGKQYTTQPQEMGTIEGSLSYPGEGIPEDLKICALQVLTRQEICTTEHIINSNYNSGVGYKLKVPAGDYYVYAATSSYANYKAYYSEFVTCGQSADCGSHAPILIPVRVGEITLNVDPADWYNM